MKIGIVLALIAISCTSSENVGVSSSSPEIDQIHQKSIHEFTLNDYLTVDSQLNYHVDSIFNSLTDSDKVAQLLMPAIGRLGQHEDTIKSLISRKQIGGILMLNGTKEQFKGWIAEFDILNDSLGALPFLYSADAEPSLVNRKITGSKPVKKASEIATSEEVQLCAKSIADDLNHIGINYNFAPVVDVAKNSTVGYRGFGSKPENILPFSKLFIATMQSSNIIATAKHFPGHGLVSGDTHKSLQTIDGELKELSNYPPLIEDGVLSIMIAHIAVINNTKYDTHGMPATTSKKIVTDLLRDELKFEGLIVTDAMNMGGVAKVKDADILAIGAGCDILLMPLNCADSHTNLLNKYISDDSFKKQVDSSVKRIIRMKICLGLF